MQRAELSGPIQRTASRWGYPPEEMQGKSVWDFIADEEETISQERFNASDRRFGRMSRVPSPYAKTSDALLKGDSVNQICFQRS
jgi:hypothetical protein